MGVCEPLRSQSSLVSRSVSELKLRPRWILIALVCLFLALDESAMIHEKLNKSMRALLGREDLGFLSFAWVVPYGIGVLAFGVFMIPFLRSLTSRLRIGLIISASFFLGGALGVEMVTAELYGDVSESLGYRSMVALEECLEMIGVIFFVRCLLSELESSSLPIRLSFSKRVA